MINKMIRKDLRRSYNPAVWSAVIYFILMNVVIMAFVVVLAVLESVFTSMGYAGDGTPWASDITKLAWGYVITVALGLVILLLWKKPKYFREELLAKGRPMTVGSFLQLLCLFLGVQLFTSLLNTLLESILNVLGLSMMGVMESTSGMQDGFAMFFYASILAPITEELLFRGLIQRTLMRYGKQFAIFASAFLFGIFHGNLAQTPFAFVIGLVLGYVTAEYNILWAMVLHMVNNLVLADMLTRLTSGMPEMLSNLLVSCIIILCGIGAIVILCVNLKKIQAYLRREKIHGLCMQAFFSHPAVIILMILTLMNCILSISPL